MKHSYQQHLERLNGKERFALWVTNHVGTVECAIVFALIGIGSIIGLITNNTALALVCGAVSSYFLQLVLLPIIMVGQNLQNKHSELRAELDLKVDQDSEGILKEILHILNDNPPHKVKTLHRRPRPPVR